MVLEAKLVWNDTEGSGAMNDVTPTVEAISRLRLEGNILPLSWFEYVRMKDGKPNPSGNPDPVAVILLADIVGWYIPKVERDEETGRIIGIHKRFRADKLQKSYQALADEFGFTKRQVADALHRLQKAGYISITFRNFAVGGMMLSNVVFLEPIPAAIEAITFPRKVIRSKPPHAKVGDLPRQNVIPPTPERETYTKSTTNSTTKEERTPKNGVPDLPSLKVQERLSETDAKLEEYYVAYQKGMSTGADEMAPLLESVKRKIRPILLDAMAKGITALAVQNVIAHTVSNPKWRPFNAATDLANAINTLGPWRARGRPDRW